MKSNQVKKNHSHKGYVNDDCALLSVEIKLFSILCPSLIKNTNRFNDFALSSEVRGKLTTSGRQT